MSIELLSEAMKFDAVARRERRSDRASAALPDNVIPFPLTCGLSGRQPLPSTTAAGAASASVLRLVHSAASDERQELTSLLGRLDRFELPGDVGRMVYLALENAADERAQPVVQAPPLGRDHALKRAARRLLRALRRASGRGRAVQPG